MAASLRDDGVFIHWLPLGYGPIDQEKMLLRAFLDVFPHGTVWQQLRFGPFLLVGTKSPLQIDYAKLQAKLQDPTIKRDLATANLHDAEDLLRLFVLGPEALRKLVGDAPPTTDDWTVLDFSMPRYAGSGFGMGSFSANVEREAALSIAREHTHYVWAFESPVVDHLTNVGGDRERIQSQIDAREVPLAVQLFAPMSEAEWRRWAERPEER